MLKINRVLNKTITNLLQHKYISISTNTSLNFVSGALGIYYFVAAISYQILSIEVHPEVTEPITASTTTIETTDITATTAEAATTHTRRSRPSVPQLPSITERSFTVVPSGDASAVPQEQQKPSDHRFVGGPMPIISY